MELYHVLSLACYCANNKMKKMYIIGIGGYRVKECPRAAFTNGQNINLINNGFTHDNKNIMSFNLRYITPGNFVGN